MSSENIKTLWRLAYIKLIGQDEDVVTLNDGEYQRVFWRFYWKIGDAYVE